MRLLSKPLVVLALAGLAGCATKDPCPPPSAASDQAGANGKPDWHDVITDPDHLRLRAWRKAMVDGLAKARASGSGAKIDAEGKLLDPDAGIDDAKIPVGYYRCRVIKLGAKATGGEDYIAYPAHRCQVRPSDDITRLVELNGLQKPSGKLYQDGPSRVVFLGTMILGDEVKPIAYGRDADRDIVGIVQRVEPGRWRMIMPQPAWESMADVMELVPEG
jgi:predicted small lipoprotein YifL